MTALVNGVPTELPDDSTVADVITKLGHNAQGRGIAVAVNGEVVPRAEWASHPLADGDSVELLVAVQGG